MARKSLLLAVFLIVPALCFSGELVVDTFKVEDKGLFPSGWEAVKGKEKKKAREVYKVVVENGNAVLYAHSVGNAITIGKKIEVDLSKFPILRWRWKVTKLPKGADERFKETGDSAAAIYVYFPSGFRKWNPKAIKYVWSSTELPKGYVTKSPYAGRTKIVILENRFSPLGKWIEEEVNVKLDYERFFGRKLKKAKGVGIMTDSDNTKSEAEAYYDDIRFSSE